MFYDIYVRAVWGPFKFVDLLLVEPISGEAGCVLWIIILLKVDILLVDPKITEGPKKFVIKDLGVKLCIHDALDVTNSSWPLSCDASPNHNIPTAMFDGFLHKVLVKSLSKSPPTPFTEPSNTIHGHPS